MPEKSAGLLMYAYSKTHQLYVFLIHPGGPFFWKKDDGVWSIPKGLLETGEEPLTAAKREFEEEVGLVPEGECFELGTVRLKSGKVVQAWAFEKKGFDPEKDQLIVKSNVFTMEWPPHSGQQVTFPEADRGEFFGLERAYQKINPAQSDFITRLQSKLM